jgi:hypothetical protein
MAERTTRYYDFGVELHEPTVARPYYRIIYRTPEGQRRMPSAGRDLEQAMAKASDIVEMLRGSLADPSGRTVNELLNAWLPTVEAGNAGSHYDKYLSMSSRFISPLLGTESAWNLSKETVQACAATPTAASAKRHTANALGAMLTWGHANDWISEPREFFFPRQPRTAKKDKGRQHGESVQFIPPRLRPSAEACRQLAQAALNSSERHGEARWLMVAAAASVGLRQGELFAAPTDALRPDAGEWFIDRQVVRIRLKCTPCEGKGQVDGRVCGGCNGKGRTKDESAIVTDPKWGRVRASILPELTIWGEPFRDRLMTYANTLPTGGLLFPAQQGGFRHPSNEARDWSKAARVAAAPAWAANFTWHSLRHAFCSDLLNVKKARDTDVALVAGHRDSGVTRAMYVGATAGTTGRLNALMMPTTDDEEAVA